MYILEKTNRQMNMKFLAPMAAFTLKKSKRVKSSQSIQKLEDGGKTNKTFKSFVYVPPKRVKFLQSLDRSPLFCQPIHHRPSCKTISNQIHDIKSR